ncbi:MAG: hypothetical protein SGJ20_19665 [Planctomycetota bacterium]|nr:hypothetical protein [Planctomycetota bacterium]
MKAMSSGSGGMKEKLINHGEKIVLGITAVCVCYFLYSAFSMEPLPANSSPTELGKLANNARINIDTAQPTPVLIEVNVIDLDKQFAESKRPVVLADVTINARLDPPKFPAINTRVIPDLFPIENLIATPVTISVALASTPLPGGAPGAAPGGGFGPPGAPRMIAPPPPPRGGPTARPPGGLIQPPTKGRGPRGAAVPVPEPADAVTDILAEPFVPPGVNVPDAKAEVRQAVVLVGRIPFSRQQDEFQAKFIEAIRPPQHDITGDVPKYSEFQIERQEITDGPEKPWEKRDLNVIFWQDQAKWAVPAAETETVDRTYVDPYVTWPMPPILLRNWGLLATHPSIPLEPRGEQAAMAVVAPLAATPFGPPKRKLEDERGRSQIIDQPADAGLQPLKASKPYLLFRCVDSFGLQPGKKYRYRVALQLLNPNFDVPPAMLKEPKTSTVEYLWTAPSAPTQVVTILPERQALAIDIKPGRTPIETSAEVLIHIWDRAKGVEIATPATTQLGGLVTHTANVNDHINPAQGRTVEPEFEYKFDLGGDSALLVDVRDGEPDAGALGQPVEVLYTDATGKIYSSNHAWDGATAEYYKLRYVGEAPAELLQIEDPGTPGGNPLLGPGGRPRREPRNP